MIMKTVIIAGADQFCFLNILTLDMNLLTDNIFDGYLFNKQNN